MPKLKQKIKEITSTAKCSNDAGRGLDTGDLKNRILDCRGALALAIDGILNGDTDSIDAAVGSSSLVERELQQIDVTIDLAQIEARR